MIVADEQNAVVAKMTVHGFVSSLASLAFRCGLLTAQIESDITWKCGNSAGERHAIGFYPRYTQEIDYFALEPVALLL
jgi:hypothetical protein